MEKLISMTDFVFMLRNRTTSELCKDFPKSFTLPVYNGNKDDMVKKMLGIDAIQWKLTGEYAKFLKQPLTLGMFVPCDLDGNTIESPDLFNYHIDEEGSRLYNFRLKEYQEAKERVLFEGFSIVGEKHVGNKYNVFGIGFKNGHYKIVEDLINRMNSDQDILLTESAKKQIGL